MIVGAKIPLQASFPLSTRGEFLSQLLAGERELPAAARPLRVERHVSAGSQPRAARAALLAFPLTSSLPEGFNGERAISPMLKLGHRYFRQESPGKVSVLGYKRNASGKVLPINVGRAQNLQRFWHTQSPWRAPDCHPRPPFPHHPSQQRRGSSHKAPVLPSLPAFFTSPHDFVFILGNVEKIYEGKTEHGLSTIPHLLHWKRQKTENARAMLGCQP